MKKYTLPWVTALLVGCSASIPVHQVSTPEAVKKEGTLLVLPRAELALSYDQVETSYTPGIWTAELLRCKSQHGISADLPPGDFAAKVTDMSVPQSCLEIYRLGLDATGFEKIKKQVCTSDTAAKGWTRYGIDAQSLKVSAVAVRDPEQVYWVETPVRWLSSVDVTVKYSPAGTVDGAKTVATNAWSDFAAKALGAAAKIALASGGSDPDAEKIRTRLRRPQCTLSSADGKGKSDLICDEIVQTLLALKKASEDVGVLISSAQGPSFDKQLELLIARVKEIEALFEGSLSKTMTTRRASWIPVADKDTACLSGKDPDDALRCRNRKLLQESQVWLCGNGFRQDPANGRDQYQGLVLEGWVEESPAVEKTLDAVAAKSAAGFSPAAADRRGLPYRIVPRTRVKAITQTCTYKTNARDEIPQCTDGAKPINEALPIPQYGWVGRLAPKAGGRKATFDVDYNADTGELVSVQVAGEGSDPSAVQDALLSRIKEDKKPTELDALTAEKERVVLLKEICVAYASLSADKPDFCTQ